MTSVDMPPPRTVALVRSCAVKSWVVFRDNWLPLTVLAFLVGWFPLLAFGLAFTLFVAVPGWNLLVGAVAAAIVGAGISACYLKLILSLLDSGYVRWRLLFSELHRAPAMLACNFATWAAVGIGLVFLIVPGIFLLVRCLLAGFVLVDEQASVTAALSRSYRLLSGAYGLSAAAIAVMALVLSQIPLISWGLGPLQTLAFAVLYRTASDREEDG